MNLSADASLFFTDFAESITIDGRQVDALIDTEIAEVFALVSGVSMTIRVPSGTPVAKSSVVIARGITYDVIRPPFDDHGILILPLSAA